MDMDDSYQPIPCALQDRYERAIVTGHPLSLDWPSGAGDRRLHDRVRVMDLETAHGAEYVRFADSQGTIHRVRLDRVRLHDDT